MIGKYITLFFFIASCNDDKDEFANSCRKEYGLPINKVSLDNPDKIKEHEGKFIEVQGVFRYNFEDVAIYFSRRAYSDKALWLNFSKSLEEFSVTKQKMNERTVTLVGKVNMKSHGHLGAYMGELDSVFCIKLK